VRLQSQIFTNPDLNLMQLEVTEHLHLWYCTSPGVLFSSTLLGRPFLSIAFLAAPSSLVIQWRSDDNRHAFPFPCRLPYLPASFCYIVGAPRVKQNPIKISVQETSVGPRKKYFMANSASIL
jgi:hypothetical protein